jgi:hypothetical protein
MENLAEVEARIGIAQRESTITQADIKGAIVELAWHLKKEGYSQSAIENYPKYLRLLVKYGADLYNPENVKEVIANQETWETRAKYLR